MKELKPKHSTSNHKNDSKSNQPFFSERKFFGGGEFFKPSSPVIQKKSKTQTKDIKLTLAADKEAEYYDKAYFRGFEIGHSWVMIERADKSQDSYGFWPKTVFNASRFWESVDGKVKHPDTSHTPTAMFSAKVSQDELQKGEKYAADNANSKYNVLTYNCTHFARDFFQKCGQYAPPAGLIIEDPNALHDAIEKHNGYKGLTPLETEKPPKKSK